MYELDVHLTRLINGLAGTWASLDAASVWMSALGVPLMVAATALQWWPALDRVRLRQTLICAGLAFVGGLAINQLLLIFVHRMRPYDAGITHLIIAPSADPSFPSDHATAAAAIAGVFILRGFARRGSLLLVPAVLVAMSRVYVGIHYLSDVAGGAVTGSLAALIVTRFYPAGSRIDRFLTAIF